jgi:GH15 family glucan-1,4-alpha-glucosidase
MSNNIDIQKMEYSIEILIKELSECKNTLEFIISDDFTGTSSEKVKLVSLYENKIKSLVKGIESINKYINTTIPENHTIFEGIAKDINGHIGLISDGILIDCDNQPHTDFHMISGEKYRATIEKIN